MGTFTSNVPLSPILWGTGTLPHNWEKFSDSAKECYKNNFITACMVGVDNKSAHAHAMKAVKEGHKMKGGQWVPK